MNIKPLNIEKHIEHVISILIEYTPKVVGALLVLIIGMWLIKRLSKIATRSMERRDLDISLRSFLRSLISIGLKVILIVTVAGMIGIGTTSFVTILGAAGLAVGLALQGSLSNFAGGVLILIFKPYRVGDTIEAQGQSGTVKEIQIFNTILLTADLKTIILPNGAVSNGTIVNYTKNGVLRGDVQVVISAANDIDKVKELLTEALLKHEHILKDPIPEIAAVKIIDNAVTLSIKPYSSAANYAQINSDVVEIVKRIFDKHDITAPIQKRIVFNG
ncbi:MAG: mechanosensitive ion channel domain-containing protein [Bacteroidota bacterium]